MAILAGIGCSSYTVPLPLVIKNIQDCQEVGISQGKEKTEAWCQSEELVSQEESSHCADSLTREPYRPPYKRLELRHGWANDGQDTRDQDCLGVCNFALHIKPEPHVRTMKTDLVG